MPVVGVEGFGHQQVALGKRLLVALIEDFAVDPIHLCGGKAICGRCVVEFIDDEPTAMTLAEETKLHEKGLDGMRLACQIPCDRDMNLRVVERLSEADDTKVPGPLPADEIVPDPQWINKP